VIYLNTEKEKAARQFGCSPATQDSFRCVLLSFSETYRLSRLLSHKIKASGYQPDLIVAIGRGGYVPGRLVCDFLLFNDLTSMKIEHYMRGADMQAEARIKFPISVDISGKKVLIVDDVTDTGETLLLAVDYVQSLNPSEIRTAVLQHKTCSTFIPDFFVHRIINWRWIIYPWAAFEDISGFIKRVMQDKYVNTNDIQQNLNRDFQLLVRVNDLTQILEQMTLSGLLEKKEMGGESLWRLMKL